MSLKVLADWFCCIHLQVQDDRDASDAEDGPTHAMQSLQASLDAIKAAAQDVAAQAQTQNVQRHATPPRPHSARASHVHATGLPTTTAHVPAKADEQSPAHTDDHNEHRRSATPMSASVAHAAKWPPVRKPASAAASRSAWVPAYAPSHHTLPAMAIQLDAALTSVHAGRRLMPQLWRAHGTSGFADFQPHPPLRIRHAQAMRRARSASPPHGQAAYAGAHAPAQHKHGRFGGFAGLDQDVWSSTRAWRASSSAAGGPAALTSAWRPQSAGGAYAAAEAAALPVAIPCGHSTKPNAWPLAQPRMQRITHLHNRQTVANPQKGFRQR